MARLELVSFSIWDFVPHFYAKVFSHFEQGYTQKVIHRRIGKLLKTMFLGSEKVNIKLIHRYLGQTRDSGPLRVGQNCHFGSSYWLNGVDDKNIGGV